jgi:hypothetical protein
LIDFDLEIKNMQPINIRNMELKRYKIDDNIIKSIILYNKAISEIKTKDLDLAINDVNYSPPKRCELLGQYYYCSKFTRANKVIPTSTISF